MTLSHRYDTSPSTESIVRIHYDSDLEDESNDRTRPDDERPLLTKTPLTPTQGLNARSSLRNIGRIQEGSDHSLHTLQDPNSQATGRQMSATSSGEILKKRQWADWCRIHGLHPSTWTGQTYIKAALLMTLVTLVILAFTVFKVQNHIKDILHYIDDHRNVGAVLFVVFYTIACWLFLPGSLFTIGAGFLFKPMPFALAIVIIGDMLGAIGSFLFGRYIFYDWVKGMMSKHPKFTALDEVIKDDGWKIVVMLRLTPIPFNLITYFFSITSISLATLTWATAVGIFPGSCLGIWIGSLLKGLSGIDNPELEPKNIVILVMNGVFIVCCILTLSIFGKRSLRKALAKLDHHQRFHHHQDDSSETEEEYERFHGHHPRAIDRITESILEQTDVEDDEETATAASSHSESQTTTAEVSPHVPKRIPESLRDTGFTRVEKWMFAGIAVAAILNLCICIPLYSHYADQEDL
ncbi:hypothetical protein FBU30_006644 [Linnemannia zychae]|nr:hypothetical protein FBU30_006644 [Linnemannia zychae]